MSLTCKLKEAGYSAAAIAGPTASGKTGLSLFVADKLGAEIISCDSMQIYKGMDIGTAKATQNERERVPHHMIDVCGIGESYSAADYARDATLCADDIIKRGRFPLFCGGTGLYLDAVMRGGYSASPGASEELRAQLLEYYNTHGADALYAMLCETDPDSAEKIHKNNVKRVIRALEIAKSTGITKAEYDKENSEYRGLSVFVVCLNFHNRETLYSRIERRVDEMIEAGLADEVRLLSQNKDFMENQTAVQAIGYKELFPYIRGEASLEECADALKAATRRYAKRQLTWFMHREYTHVLWADREDGTLKGQDELAEEFFSLIK